MASGGVGRLVHVAGDLGSCRVASGGVGRLVHVAGDLGVL